MPTYTVHAPSPPVSGSSHGLEQFVFVRDGFHFWAFVLAPLWLLLHRLWIAFFIYAAGFGALVFGLIVARVPWGVQLIVVLLVALLMGFEASSVWRWTLKRRGWTTLGFVIGEDTETAERRFFAEWTKRAADVPSAAPSAGPKYSTPVRRGPPSPSDVIGLFPEPGGPR
jgi:hypothetical protein